MDLNLSIATTAFQANYLKNLPNAKCSPPVKYGASLGCIEIVSTAVLPVGYTRVQLDVGCQATSPPSNGHRWHNLGYVGAHSRVRYGKQRAMVCFTAGANPGEGCRSSWQYISDETTASHSIEGPWQDYFTYFNLICRRWHAKEPSTICDLILKWMMMPRQSLRMAGGIVNSGLLCDGKPGEMKLPRARGQWYGLAFAAPVHSERDPVCASARYMPEFADPRTAHTCGVSTNSIQGKSLVTIALRVSYGRRLL